MNEEYPAAMGAIEMRPNGPMGFLHGLSKKTWMIIGAVGVAILVIVIVVPVEVAKENAYPNYSAINYTLTDTYSGESFFDYFEYFTATVSPLELASVQCSY